MTPCYYMEMALFWMSGWGRSPLISCCIYCSKLSRGPGCFELWYWSLLTFTAFSRVVLKRSLLGLSSNNLEQTWVTEAVVMKWPKTVTALRTAESIQRKFMENKHTICLRGQFVEPRFFLYNENRPGSGLNIRIIFRKLYLSQRIIYAHLCRTA